MKKKDLLAATREHLLKIASRLGIRGRYRMSKKQLVNSIEKAMRSQSAEDLLSEGVVPSVPTDGSQQPADSEQGRSKRRISAPIRQKAVIRKTWREQQAAVQHAKYEVKVGKQPVHLEPAEERLALPTSYEETKIVLLVRDPYWVHVYWEVSRDALLKAMAELGKEWDSAVSVLRVYDITGIEFDGTNAHSCFDIEISGGSNNWYIHTGVPNRTFCVEIGIRGPSGKFVALARSNKVTTPRDAPSDITDERWMIPDWQFERIYALSGGFRNAGGSVEIVNLMRKALGAEISSGAPGSLGIPGSFAITSPAVREIREKAFWFRLGTELIVYGATEPDAKVYLQGRPVTLRHDGTFTARFELPDGKQVIPAVAESNDGSHRIEITPTVTKRTRRKG
ncbi:MAG: DUF4912 domain-containing protein [bacterium]